MSLAHEQSLMEAKLDNQGNVTVSKQELEPIKLQCNRSSSGITEPESVEVPRKITNFRVVMERKLGIDWEHEQDENQITEHDSDEEESQDDF